MSTETVKIDLLWLFEKRKIFFFKKGPVLFQKLFISSLQSNALARKALQFSFPVPDLWQ